MKNRDYWRKRFTYLENKMNSYSMDVYRNLEETFYRVQREIEYEIEYWYSRIAVNNKVSIIDAKKLLTNKELIEFKWSVEEFIKYGKKNSINNKWIKELENASARHHISKLDALKISVQQLIEKVFGNELDEVDSLMRRIYCENYYNTLFEVQKGFKVAWSFSKIDENKLDKIIKNPWAVDGKDFSSRIWTLKDKMVKELHNELVRTCIMGEAPDEAISNMTKFVDKKFKNAKVHAGKLVMTEQAYFSSLAQKDVFDFLDVEEYEIVATLDSHTSKICQELDGKHFQMKDFEAGVTAPPFHVWCRSTTVPYFDDDYEIERAARGFDGKTYYIPGDMNYSEWYKKYVL